MNASTNANSATFQRPFSYRERLAALRQLKSESALFDLAIIGGGVTGAAIARDAALRGLKVLLVEKDDFAGGTSSRSSKLVHGGVRYLEQYEFKLVTESTRERARLWKLAPQLVTPLPFLFPAHAGDRVPLWKLNLGLWLYDLLAVFRTPSLHRKYGPTRTLREEPGLRAEGLRGAIFYWDGMTDDARLTLANILEAGDRGAVTLARTEFTGITWNPDVGSAADQGHALRLRDALTGEEYAARARVVVSAAGPWTDRLLATGGVLQKQKLLAPTRGSHIVVPAARLPAKHAVVMLHPKDGRVLFVIPWGEATIIGTTDLFDANEPERVAINAEEVGYLVNAGNYYFPQAALQSSDVLSTWSGLRPLLAPPSDASASEVSRDHHIEWRDPGLLVIAGGKLTTHREMAEQALERVFAETHRWAATLGPGYRATETHQRAFARFADGNSDPARAIGQSEAARLSLDDVRAICRTQMVLSLEDLLVRRTQIFYKEPLNGWALLDRLRPVLCEELGWDATEWARQVAAYRAYLARNVYEPLQRTLP